MEKQIRTTRSVCPVCRKNISAILKQDDAGRVFLERTCEEHGSFRALIWQGTRDFEQWTAGADPLKEKEGQSCPENCGICGEHEKGTCCALLEVTKRCNLRCRYCFADGGSEEEDPSFETVQGQIRDIVRLCGHPLLQLSGGEPTLRDDLPELVRFAKEAGCSYVQLNTNGLRLANEPDYAKRLKEAGLDIVFLQFDGTKEEIYEILRGKPLLQTKLETIRVCSDLGIGVTLVPTVVRGVNDNDLGELVSLAASLTPGVRGIHFQPVSYFGRFPKRPDEEERYTLDQLMSDLSSQTKLPMEYFKPSRCDHPLCGFHASFLINKKGRLQPLIQIPQESESCCSAETNREYVARHWTRKENPSEQECCCTDSMDLDGFLYQLHNKSLTLTAMAFQDVMNLNIERLHRCSLHVYDDGKIKPFCVKYL